MLLIQKQEQELSELIKKQKERGEVSLLVKECWRFSSADVNLIPARGMAWDRGVGFSLAGQLINNLNPGEGVSGPN